jgi:hypothetical protein
MLYQNYLRDLLDSHTQNQEVLRADKQICDFVTQHE